MLDIGDLLDYCQDDCVFDIFDCNLGANIKESIDRNELEEWCEKHDYQLESFEPIQRKEQRAVGSETIYGIVFNVSNVEETN